MSTVHSREIGHSIGCLDLPHHHRVLERHGPALRHRRAVGEAAPHHLLGGDGQTDGGRRRATDEEGDVLHDPVGMNPRVEEAGVGGADERRAAAREVQDSPDPAGSV